MRAISSSRRPRSRSNDPRRVVATMARPGSTSPTARKRCGGRSGRAGRRRRGTGGDACLEHRLDDSEHPRQDAVVERSLQHRVVADVDDTVADADDPEQDKGDGRHRHDGAHRERQTPRDEACHQRPVDAAGDRRRSWRGEAHETADADRPHSRPTPASPVRSTSIANKTTMTLVAPRTNVCVVPSAVTRRPARLAASWRAPATYSPDRAVPIAAADPTPPSRSAAVVRSHRRRASRHPSRRAAPGHPGQRPRGCRARDRRRSWRRRGIRWPRWLPTVRSVSEPTPASAR